MAHTERYETVIRLNTEQAKTEIDRLTKKVDELKKKRSIIDPLDVKALEKINDEIKKEEAKLKSVENKYDNIARTIKNMSAAGPKELRDTIKSINVLLNSGSVERGSKQWKYLTSSLREANTELAKIRTETKASQSAFSRFFKFLNDSWGGIFVIMQSVSGIRSTLQDTVKDFAQMEEAMADTRKYTGLADDAIRNLNDDLKKMDTRTSREELNELAGAAGRLGKTSKKDILEFVEAGNMIKVALGDDLGEGAIDNVGKLAMAFGEDEKMGLRGAMLATGSAINELAQNSSAQAGYLVDFTARVAGFGKQLGLTQAQIMGFGAVMDENLLRDEMAATAFGNMLTKMQTDTAKFAKIAGMDFKKFSELLKTDANGAILALADSLKRADPQTMMKMLDDMGLDGSRAVGVLSTIADKIDDVRVRQELATKAYQEGTSVQKEYSVMNNTVQAEIDKAKKRFHEMSVELGEKLVPVVKYAISGAALMTKTLNVLTNFLFQNGKAIVFYVSQIALLTAVYKAAEIRAYAWYLKELLLDKLHKAQLVLMKARTAAVLTYNAAVALLTGNVTRAAAAMRLMRAAAISNPYTALLTVILTLGTAVYAAVTAWKKHSQAVKENSQAIKEVRAAHQVFNDVKKEAAKATVEEKTKIEQLTKIIRSNAYSVDQRRAAIKKLQGIIPGYHASLDNEGIKLTENTRAIEEYIKKLDDMAMAQAIFSKKREINERKVENLLKKQKIQNSLNAVQAERDAHPERYQSRKTTYMSGATEERNALLVESQQQEQRHKQRMQEAMSEERIIDAEERVLDKMINSNRNIRSAVTTMMTGNGDSTTTEGNTPPSGPTYTPTPKGGKGKTPDPEKERIKKLREQAREEKAITDAQLADNMLAYSAGLKDYRQFTEDQLEIRKEGLKALLKVWESEPAEYAKVQKQLAALILNGDEEMSRFRASEFERAHMILMQQLEREFVTEGSAIYQNELAYNEARFQEEIAYLEDRKELTREGSLERMQIEWEIEDRIREHQLENERTFHEQLTKYREQYSLEGVELREKVELDGLKRMYDELKKTGAMSEEEYQELLKRIRAKYAKERADGAEGIANNTRQSTQKAEQENRMREIIAKVENEASKIRDKKEGKSPTMFQAIFGDIDQYASQFSILKQMYADHQISFEEMMQGMLDTSANMAGAIGEKLQMAMDAVTPLMDAMSSYYSAQSDYEVAMVEKKYEKQIAAAGKNQARQKKLEEKKEKEIAAIKTKYNRKQVKMQIAQALAQTAISALNAYASVWAGAPWPANTILAPIAAGIATAAGMLQVAAIKKQAQAQEAGYYEGGFTGGRRYREEAGVVHEGEFVANHQAVNNPNVLPFLNFLDQAQRSNTIGSLTREDIARQLGTVGTMLAPVVNVSTDNGDMRQSAAKLSGAASELRERLSQPIPCYVVLDGPDGLMSQIKHLENLKKV